MRTKFITPVPRRARTKRAVLMVTALALIHTSALVLPKGSNLLWAAGATTSALEKYAVERQGLTLSPLAKHVDTLATVTRLFEQLGSDDHPSTALLDMSFEQLKAVADRFKAETRGRLNFKNSNVYIVNPNDLSKENTHAIGDEAAKHLAQRLEGVLKDAAVAKKKTYVFIPDLGRYAKYIAPTLLKLKKEKQLQVIGTSDSKTYADVIEKDANLMSMFATVTFETPKKATLQEELFAYRDELMNRPPSKLGDAELQPVIADEVILALPSTITSNFSKEVDSFDMAKKVLERALGVWKEAASKEAEASGSYNPSLNMTHVSKAIAAITRRPVVRAEKEQAEYLLNFVKHLDKDVMGQDYAKQAMARVARRTGGGLYDPSRPRSTSIYFGPTGVGKTELAKAFARHYLGDENAFLYFNMNEYMEKHTASRLVGAPPSYVGYEEGGELTNKLKKFKKVVVLFDEIEKAHQSVWDMLMQLLDEGRISSAKGEQFTAEGREIHIVMTTNLGQQVTIAKIPPEQAIAEVRKDLLKYFRPETLNRIREIVPFYPLTKAELRLILRKEVKKANELFPGLIEWETKLELDPTAENVIIALGYHPEFGARPLKSSAEKNLYDPLNEFFLETKKEEKRLPPGTSLKVSAERGTEAGTTTMKATATMGDQAIGNFSYVIGVNFDEVEKAMSGDESSGVNTTEEIKKKVEADMKAKEQEIKEIAASLPKISDAALAKAKARLERLIDENKQKFPLLKDIKFTVTNDAVELLQLMEKRTDQPKELMADTVKFKVAANMQALEEKIKKENAAAIAKAQDPSVVVETNVTVHGAEHVVGNYEGQGTAGIWLQIEQVLKNTNPKIKSKTIGNALGPISIPVASVSFALFQQFQKVRTGVTPAVEEVAPGAATVAETLPAPAASPKKLTRAELIAELERMKSEDPSTYEEITGKKCGAKLDLPSGSSGPTPQSPAHEEPHSGASD